MKTILREEQSGVAEVVGTILILGMTVTLFSVIIIWVASFPVPQAQNRVDLLAHLDPIYDARGIEVGVNITVQHQGGASMESALTVLYVSDQVGNNAPTIDVVTLHLFNGRLANPNGLLDGTDSVWNLGERWRYENFAFRSADRITLTVVDTQRSLLLWTGVLNPTPGIRPPIFVDVWTDGIPSTPQRDLVQAGLGYVLYAEVADPDGNLNLNSVYATITGWYGSGTSCGAPMQMTDDGYSGAHFAGSHLFSLGPNVCVNPPYPPLTWSGSFILLNATDLNGHQSTTRFTLYVYPQTTGGGFNQTTIPSQLWQYIGYVQIRTGEVWLSNLSAPYSTTNTFQPFRVPKSWMSAGVLFHFKMANHGNTTIFIDGWTEAFFQNTQSSSGTALFIVAPCSTSVNANAGGVTAYPGTPTNINDFEYAHTGLPAGCSSSTPAGVFDIAPLNQEVGGTPYAVMVNTKTAFTGPTTSQWQSATYFMSILVSGMAGPQNYTYSMLTGNGPNPFSCSGLGANYNPRDHLLDPISKCRTQWYAQVIPFIGMVVY